MTCQELTERASDALDGHQTPTEQEKFRLHLAGCGPCRVYLRQMEATVRLSGQLAAQEVVPDRVSNAVLAHLRKLPATDSAPAPAWAELPAGPMAAGLLSFLKRWGWHVAGAAIFAAFVLAAVAGGSGVPSRTVAGLHCLLDELAVALAPLAAVVWVARRQRHRLAGGVLPAVAAAGALLGQIILQVTCPMTVVRPHLIAFHATGVLVAALLGAAATRLLPAR